MKRIIITILVLFLFCTCVCAQPDDTYTLDEIYNQQYEASGAKELDSKLDEQTRQILLDLGIDIKTPNTDGISVKSVFKSIFKLFTNSLKLPIRSAALVVCAIMICSTFRSIYSEKTGDISKTADYVCTVCICTAAVVPFSSVISRMVASISVCSGFMLALVPVYCSILIALGRGVTASGISTLVFALAQTVARLAKTVITPFCGMYLAFSVSASFSSDMGLKTITQSVKKAVFWILGTAMTVFTSVLVITGAVNSASDSVSQRTAKFIIGNFIPVAGGAISDALGSVSSCLGLLKSGVWSYGLCAVLFLMLPIIFETLLWRGSFSVMSAFAEIFNQQQCASMLKGMGDGAGIILSILICILVLLIVSLSMMFIGGKSIWAA